jgi:hypothetical protein
MADIDPAAIELPPTQPIDITVILAEISGPPRVIADRAALDPEVT